MIVYHASKKGFINDVFNGTIANDMTMLSCPIWEDTSKKSFNEYGNWALEEIILEPKILFIPPL